MNLANLSIVNNNSSEWSEAPKLIQKSTHYPYIYTSYQTSTDIVYGGKTILSVLWQNGQAFLQGDYELPDNELDIYVDADNTVKHLDQLHIIGEEDTEALANWFAQAIGDSVTVDDLAAMRERLFDNKPASPSSDTDDYSYWVDILERDQDGAPTIIDSKQVDFDGLVALQTVHGHGNLEITDIELTTVLDEQINQESQTIDTPNDSKTTYFAVYGQGVIWGAGHTYDDAVADADQWVNQEKDPEKPSLSELLESSQGYRYGDGWSVLPCTKAVFDEVALHGGQIGFTIEHDTIMLDGKET